MNAQSTKITCFLRNDPIHYVANQVRYLRQFDDPSKQPCSE